MSTMYDILDKDHDSVDEEMDPRQDEADEWGNDEEDGLATTEPSSWCQLTEEHCRAYFIWKHQTDVTRVCGNLRAECNRKSHKTPTMRRGEPGFYAELQPVTKNSKVDGNQEVYKTVEQMQADLKANDDRLTSQMTALATSPDFQAYPGEAQTESVIDEEDGLGPLRRFTSGLETRMSSAKKALLASPGVGGARVPLQIGDRVKTIRSTLFGTTTTPQQQERARLETKVRTMEAEVNYRTTMEAIAAMTNETYTRPRDRDTAIANQAQAQARLDAFNQRIQRIEELEEFANDGHDPEDEDDDQPTSPTTLHDHAYLANLESQWRTLKDKLRNQDATSRTPSAGGQARVATLQNKMAHAEKWVASNSHAQHPEETKRELLKARVAELQQAAAAEAEEERRAGMSALEAHIRRLETDAADRAAAKKARETAKAGPAADSMMAALMDKIEKLSAQVRGNQNAKTKPTSVTPLEVTDPRVSILQTKIETLEDQLAAQRGREHHDQIKCEPPDVVSTMRAQIMALEAQLGKAPTSRATQGDNPIGKDFNARNAVEPKELHPTDIGTAGPFEGHQHTSSVERASGHFTYSDIIPAKTDVSTGDTIYGVSLRMPRKVLDALCPEGMSETAKLQIAESGLDVASLPGKYRMSSSGDGSDAQEVLANNLGRVLDMAGERALGGAVSRDMNYQSERRNALEYIKTEAQLMEFRTDLEDASLEAIESSENQMRHVLYEHCVETGVIDYYVTTSRFPILIRKTLEHYRALIEHAVALSAAAGGFQYALMDLQFYAGKLAIRRKGSCTRLEVLLKVYCDLRDGHRNRFFDPKLQQKKNALMFKMAATNKTAPRDNTPGDPNKACGRCSSKLHAGKPCPFQHEKITYANARKLAYNCKDAPDFAAAAKVAFQDFLANLPAPAGGAPTPPAPRS
jgi:hypothetical protein